MSGKPETSGGTFSMETSMKAMANRGFEARLRKGYGGQAGFGPSEGVMQGLHQPVAVLLHLLEELRREPVPRVVETVALVGPQVALRLGLLLEELLLPHLLRHLRVAAAIVEQGLDDEGHDHRIVRLHALGGGRVILKKNID